MNILTLENSALDFQDRSQSSPTSFKLASIKAGVENFSTASDAKFPLHFSAALSNQGKIELKGDAALQSFKAAMDMVNLEKLQVSFKGSSGISKFGSRIQ